jgi:hypothetical protein
MTARLNGAAPRSHSAEDERSERIWWMAGLAAAVLFLIVAALINGIAYWKLSMEQQTLALSLSKSSSPGTRQFISRYHPASGDDDLTPAAPSTRPR